MEQFLWVEKYRPKTISDCILSPENRKIFENIKKDGNIPNLLFCGSSGIGKTSVAKALCNEMNVDYMFVNASIDRGIDVVRTDIHRFASSVSLMSEENQRKMVIMDEADQLTNDAQPAFRAFMEEFSSNCGFIFTCNFPSKILDAIHSRCSVIDFKIEERNKKQFLVQMVKIASDILKKENVEFDQKVLIQFVKNYFPDFRRTINELQRYSKISNKIDDGILTISSNINIDELLKHMKSMHYDDVRRWVVENLNNDPAKIYRAIFRGFKNNLNNVQLAQAVPILGDWQYKASFSADQELNLLACITELMIKCEIE